MLSWFMKLIGTMVLLDIINFSKAYSSPYEDN